MKKLFAIMMMVSLLVIPFAVYAESGQQTSQPPPVAAPLIREGDFAVKLAGALKLGTAKDEMEAESMLVAVGVAPRNGWISDYPVTPDIFAEIQKAVSDAADANRLSMGKSDGLAALQDVETYLGLAVVPDTSGTYAETQPPTSPQYADSTVVNNYYYDEGPPVVTYYPPPWDYSYLYAWVPSPFWWSGFFFPGFFVLNDFDRVVFFNGHRCVVSNHFFDHDHHRFTRVDPAGRWRGHGESWRGGGERSEARGFRTAEGRRGAESILQRSHERMTAARGPTERGFGTSRGQNVSRESFRGATGGSERSFRSTGRSEGRSFSPPMRGEGRSFSSPPMRNEGRSFSPSSTGGRGFSGGFSGGSRSFSGGSSGGFHGSGSGTGGSFGGSHGGGFRGH